MKIQSQALQEKYDKSQREIASLKKELTELKKELTQVKTLLLLHKDCPVSHAMTKLSST
jgi:peptidoglycan hydrolase CwlO-like protein